MLGGSLDRESKLVPPLGHAGPLVGWKSKLSYYQLRHHLMVLLRV